MLVQEPVSAASFPTYPGRTPIYVLFPLNGESAVGMYRHREGLLVSNASHMGWGNPHVAPPGNVSSAQPIISSLLLSAPS